MENLVLQAIGNAKVERINKIKKNKEFLSRLINDLQQVYTLYVSNRDDQDSTTYHIKKQSNYINTLFFTADENGCRFRTKILGYRTNLGWITNKYDTCKGDSGFNGEYFHGHIEVVINFTDVSANLMDIIKDITRILDHERVSKKF
jgi:hypothetical protein